MNNDERGHKIHSAVILTDAGRPLKITSQPAFPFNLRIFERNQILFAALPNRHQASSAQPWRPQLSREHKKMSCRASSRAGVNIDESSMTLSGVDEHGICHSPQRTVVLRRRNYRRARHCSLSTAQQASCTVKSSRLASPARLGCVAHGPSAPSDRRAVPEAARRTGDRLGLEMMTRCGRRCG